MVIDTCSVINHWIVKRVLEPLENKVQTMVHRIPIVRKVSEDEGDYYDVVNQDFKVEINHFMHLHVDLIDDFIDH